ncbi:rod-binding protein [Cereibacter sphaeroides]|uniref:rod-binding protein n=1 Tax=Cereibacter sphaeroides TaxID=1063 RepID=UPI0039907A8E
MSVTITPKPSLAHDFRPDLRRKAEEFEAAFLSEMLGHAGLDAASGPFGGGIGEQQFASFLRDEQATGMVRSGGIGLAEQFYRSLTKGMDDGL